MGVCLWRRLRCIGNVFPRILYLHPALASGENSGECVISASDFDVFSSATRFPFFRCRILAALVAPYHLEKNHFSFIGGWASQGDHARILSNRGLLSRCCIISSNRGLMLLEPSSAFIVIASASTSFQLT